ncbi:MAG: type II toxin-antitoxin system RelB/DinJ family antitoxin [Synergistaceae bacterium]|jgi:addiction module RelB/DinJ family antitoxin|nr:type II toxin-antitoxin system RelB/DinJ family antitoxin [Synergistaceae bacterium]
MATIQVRVDDEMKTTADLLFSSLGLDTSTAIRMFLVKAIDYDGIPFTVNHRVPQSELREATEKKLVRLPFPFGCMKGKIWIADDFDEPLDDFKEYM